MSRTILLDESALDQALHKRGGRPQKSNTYHPYAIHATSLSSNPTANIILLDEEALSQALRLKAEQKRSRARSNSRSPSRKPGALPRRRSRRRSRSRSRKHKTDKSLQKSSSYKSEGSSTQAESTSPTVATRSSHSHSESIDATSNHSSSAASPARGRSRTKGKPSQRSKSEPSRQPQLVPMFHVHADTRKRPSLSQSLASEPVRQSSSSDDASVEKRSFFKQSVAADSVIQPVDYIESPHSADLLENMGGAQVVEMIVSRFLLTGLEKPQVSAYIDQYDDDVKQLVHKIQGEFVTLGNMAMSDDMEEIAGLIPFHYQLIADSFNMNLIAELWTDAYEHVWMNYDVDDSRQLAGPSHAVFNLKMVVKLYRRRMRARRWDKLMETDEKRIEELKELRRRRRSHSRDKRRERRARSVDTFLSNFRMS